MLSPSLRMKLSLEPIRQRMDLALAEYRHAWDYGHVNVEAKFDEACVAVARWEAYLTARGTHHLVDTPSFEHMAAEYAKSRNIRERTRFPEKR